MPLLYANSDLHVTTSEKETRGLTILEAFASGITVLAPKAGGVVENIDHGVNGLLYEPQNIEDFQKKLLHLVRDPVLRSDLGAKGVQGMDRYHWDTTVKNLVNLWQDQIKAKAPS
jgi:glycosyltransferase involved in cell wall biosynthesis